MSQIVAIDEKEVDFLKKFSQYGFNSQDELVKEAISRLRRALEKQSLEESADLYTEIYNEDKDLQELTELALAESIND